MRGVAAIVVAAGSGERLGHDLPKALVPLASRPLVSHALDGIVAAGIGRVAVVAPADHLDQVRAAVAGREGVEIAVVPGGATRSESVRAGCRAVEPWGPEIVAIHDAARALTPAAVHRRVVEALGGAVVAAAPGLPVPDTLKRADADGWLRDTVDRAEVWAVHTPQAFAAATLAAVQAWSGDRDETDDLGLFEAARDAGVVDGQARLVPGSPLDLKVTWPRDLELAEALLSAGDRFEFAGGEA